MLDPSLPIDDDILDPLREGRVLFGGKYELIRCLGAGGFGVVWFARKVGQQGRKSEVALKFLPMTLAGNAGEIDRLNREADKLELLSHENVISYRDIENEGVFWALVMEYASEGSLGAVLQKSKEEYLEPEEIEGWVKQIFAGLDYLHGKNILHRDVKPDNILINEDGVVKITDFGLSSRLRSSLTQLSAAERKEGTSGTLAYTSPQVLMRKGYHIEDDFYSVGVTIYQLLTGSTPYEDAVSMEVLAAYIKDPQIPVDGLNERRKDYHGDDASEISANWQRLVDALLSYDREKRPKSGAEALAVLEEVKSPTPFQAKARVAFPSVSTESAQASFKKAKPVEPVEPTRKAGGKQGGKKKSTSILITSICFVVVAALLALWQPWSEGVGEMKDAKVIAAEEAKQEAEKKRLDHLLKQELELSRYRTLGSLDDMERVAKSILVQNPDHAGALQAISMVKEKRAELARMEAERERKAKLSEEAGEIEADVRSALKTKDVALAKRSLSQLNYRYSDTASYRQKSSLESAIKRLEQELKKQSLVGTKAGERREFEISPGLKVAFRWCPAGEFEMGSPKSEKERNNDETQHKVILSKGFWLAETECTQAQWKAVMETSIEQQRDKANKSWPLRGKGANHPMYYVNWDETQSYLRKLRLPVGLKASLPTEAQWEYACRAGTITPFNRGRNLTTNQANYNGNYPYNGGAKGKNRASTVEVRSFKANGWGLYDMHGNVWEWCSDWYGDYRGGTQTDPTGAKDGQDRVLRGGSWIFNAWDCRSADRLRVGPGLRDSDLGFRLSLQVASQ